MDRFARSTASAWQSRPARKCQMRPDQREYNKVSVFNPMSRMFHLFKIVITCIMLPSYTNDAIKLVASFSINFVLLCHSHKLQRRAKHETAFIIRFKPGQAETERLMHARALCMHKTLYNLQHYYILSFLRFRLRGNCYCYDFASSLPSSSATIRLGEI